MNTFPVSPMIVERLGWVLVHTVWQFAAVALLAGVIVQAMRNRSANARYGLLVVGLAFSAVVPAITWMVLPDEIPNATASQTPVAGHVPQLASPPLELSDPAIAPPVSVSEYPLKSPLPGARLPVGASEPLPAEPLVVPSVGPLALLWSERAAELPRAWLAWIVAGWCIGVALCSLRPLLGWYTLRRLRRVGVSPVSDDVLATLGRVSKRLGLRRAVRVLQSTLARVPVVVGYFRPVILLPVSLVTSIPAAQLEVILAHELAHVRRHDFLVNLLQTLVETLFFYHPAVWWLSSRLRAERENCCDDLVVAVMGNRFEYGRALLAIEELRGCGSVLAVGATDGSLLARVRRIVGLPSDTASNSPWSALVLVVCGIVLAAVMSLLSWNSRVQADSSQSAKPLAATLPDSFYVKDGKGKLLAPLPGDYGNVETGVTSFEITNETIECGIIDAMTGKPVTGTRVNFRFIKPKSGDTTEEIVDDVFWGPQALSSIHFFIPDKVLGRSDRDEIEVEWGVGGNPDYEPYSPKERIPLKQFFHEGPKAARETLGTIKLSPKKEADKTATSDAVPVTPEFETVTWTASANQRADHNAVWFCSGEHVHFVLYFDGFLQTGLSGDTYTDTKVSPSLWRIRGHINAMKRRMADVEDPPNDLKAGKTSSEPRRFELAFDYRPPNYLLTIDGKELDLTKGRVFVLKDSGEIKQLAIQPAPMTDRNKPAELKAHIDGAIRQADEPANAALANHNISLADAVRDFNAENQRLGLGLDQPLLTEEEVVAAIKRSDWKRDVPHVGERAFAAFKAVAETRRLPKLAYLQAWTTEDPSPLTVIHKWQVQLYMPTPEGGFDGFTIRYTKLREETIDPKSVAWGKPDAEGLSLGLFLLPKKEKYQIGERVQLRLFVRNEGQKTIEEMTFWNITWPQTNDFTVTDQNGARVEVRNSQIEEWSGPGWIAGATAGSLDPGDVHAFRIPFELAIGGDGSNKLVGRVVDARLGQTLQLRLRAHNGSNRVPAENESRPETGSVAFTVAAAGDGLARSSPANELDFLAAYPNLSGLSLGMTEARFKAIARRERLVVQTTPGDGGKRTYAIPTGDEHLVVVMFDNGKCSGIQRIQPEPQGAIKKPVTQAEEILPPTTRPQAAPRNETKNPFAPPTVPADDPFGNPSGETPTIDASGYPVIRQEPGELRDGWVACEFGLQYRVRAETTSLVAGELPLIFVDVRNRGTFKDMGLEMFQARHDVVVDGNRFVRADKAWAGVTLLEPEGQPLTLAFALSDDWKREGEAKTPLLFAQGKHSITVSVVIAPVYPSKSEPPPQPAARRPIRRSLVCRPIEIEVRSGAWTGPPGSLGLANIRRELIAIPDFHSPKVPANLQRLVAEHQPAAGDYLVILIKSDDPGLQQAAAVVFADAWDSMNHEQIERYLLATMTHFAGLRSQYPQGVDASIGVGTRNRPGYLGMPVDRKYSAETVTTLHLDGQQVGEPVTYSALGSLTHWINTKDLPLGRHNFRLATNFTFTRGSETYRGEFRSPEFAFDMVPADTPDDLLAAPDEQLDRLVREALQVVETEYELDHPPGSFQFDQSQPDVPDSEKWRPQIRYGENKLGVASLHVPVWKLGRRLPVDLCFSVEFRIENTDTVIRCNDLVSLADREGRGYFGTFDFVHVADLLKHADTDGFVNGHLVLKPSRSAALTNENVKRYYGGAITTRPLRFKLLRVSSTGPQAEAADDTIDPNGEIAGQLVDELGQPVAGVTVVAGGSSQGLQAKEMPLKQALAELARQAGVELQLDVDALKAIELDLDAPVTASFTDETIEEALGRLIDWRGHVGAFREFRAGRLVVTTIAARQQRVAAQLPEWLQPLYTHGLLAAVDDDGQVESITTSSIMTDELLEKLTTLSKLRELHIEVTKTLTPAGLQQLGKMQNLETLSLYEVNSDGRGLGDEALQAIAELKSLQELRVSDCGLTDAGARHLEGLPQLTRLELDEGRLTDAALASIGKLRHLKHLSLSNYVGTVHYGRMHFTTAGLRSLSGLPELEELHLVGQEATADLLTSWPKLTELSLGGTTVDDACAERIASCREMKSLSLVYTAVSDEGIKQIATLPALRSLNIDSRVITDAAMEYLKAVKTLKILTLRTTQLTDESLRHIAEMKSLTRLELHGSGQPGSVTGENFSINALRQLTALPKLRTLWLTNFRSPGGYLGLADLTQLRELSLMMADIRSEDLDALEEALPNTTIHSATGGGTRLPKAKRERKPAPTQPAGNGAAVPTANGDPLVRQDRSPMVRYDVQPRTV